MNFYNDEENEKKEGAPVLPRAASPFKKTSAFGKTPLFSRAAGGIMDRLKNLSRRDMALVGLGLSVLTMVPVAEYMMSQPSADNVLEGGWGGKEKLGNMPYEPGVNGLSQGSSDGSGEVITPLSSRDPMSLILGSQPTQPAVTAPVYTPPASSMRDAMRDAGREAFSAASKSAGAPTVIPRMAAGLRGMSSFFGGGESSRTQGSLGGGKIIDDARSASSKAAKRSMVGPVAIAGYKGVASTPNSASKGAFEKLRAAADKSAGNFSGGSAMNSLDKAAADALEIGKGAGGMGAGGDSDKTGKTSGNTTKGYEHSRSGETLAEMAAKQRMQKALEWEFYKKYEIKKQIMTAVVGAISGVIGDFIKGNLTTALGMDPPPGKKCWVPMYPSTNPPTGIFDDCKKGAFAPYKVMSGGKDAKESVVQFCTCGEAAANPFPPAAGSANENPKPVSEQVVAALTDFDDILRSIVDQTAKAAGSPTDAKIVVESAKTVGAGFDKFPGVSRKVFNVLNNSRDKAQAANDAFSAKIITVRQDYSKTNDTYITLSGQVDKVYSGLSDCAKPTVNMAGKSADKVEYSLEKAKCENLKPVIETWREKAKADLANVQKTIEGHNTAFGLYGQQIGFVGKGIQEMEAKYAGISEAYAQITPKPSEVKGVADGVEVLKAMTGELFGNAGAAPASASPVPVRLASDIRGIKWESLVAKEHSFDVKDVDSNENTNWGKELVALGKGGPTTDSSARDMVSSAKRSNSIAVSINDRIPDLGADGQIKKQLKTIETGMDKIKSDITATGISPSYFSGAEPKPPVVEQPKPPVVEQPKPPVVEQPKPPVVEQPKPPVVEQPKPPVVEQPKPDPNAASAEQVAAAKANLAILKGTRTYGVGKDNGAINCTNVQSDIIRAAFKDSNDMLKGTLTKDEVSAITQNVQSACNVLSKCNPRAMGAAGCR